VCGHIFFNLIFVKGSFQIIYNTHRLNPLAFAGNARNATAAWATARILEMASATKAPSGAESLQFTAVDFDLAPSGAEYAAPKGLGPFLVLDSIKMSCLTALANCGHGKVLNTLSEV
jgi:hypothetical protein